MQASDGQWHIIRTLGFLVAASAVYCALYLWSERILRDHSDKNPVYRIQQAPESNDWVVLGSSHAMPLGFSDMPDELLARTGRSILVLGVAGGGPYVMRLTLERYLADHRTAAVLVVLDQFGFADPRWNAARLGDADFLPKIPTDPMMTRLLAQAVGHGLSWQAWLSYVTGFARITDLTRLAPDVWQAQDRFDLAARPSQAATQSRIRLLYPSMADPIALQEGLAQIEKLVILARSKGAEPVLVFPPLPEAFRRAEPRLDGFHAGIADLSARLGVELHDFSALLRGGQYFFDSDHLNRSGVRAWLDGELDSILKTKGLAIGEARSKPEAASR